MIAYFATIGPMLNPAAKIIERCGGFHAVAEMTGRNHTRVRRWTYPKDRGGTGGFIPTDVQQPLLIEARRRGIDLRPDDFFELPDAQPERGAA